MDAQDHPMSHYPALRLRRPRASGWSRRLHAETVLTPADLVWPLFVVEGEGVEQPVASLPGVSRWSVDGIVTRAKEARDLGIPCVALFPYTQPDRRSDDGREADRKSVVEGKSGSGRVDHGGGR